MDRRLWKGITVATLAAVTVGGHAQLSTPEQHGLEDALMLGNFTIADLAVDRHVHKSVPLTPFVRTALNDPLVAANRLFEWHQRSDTTELAGLLAYATSVLDEGVEAVPVTTAPVSRPAWPENAPADLPQPVKDVLYDLHAAVINADIDVRKALSALSPTETRALIESLPVHAVETSLVKFAFVQSPTMPRDTAFELVKKVDLTVIRAASINVQTAVHKASETLRQTRWTWEGQAKFRLGDLIVVVGGVGSNSHSDMDARITLDLGGDDVYTGRHGAGVGYTSVLIDVSGDDRYDLPDLNLGAGVLGIGVAADLGGDDRYRTASIALGAGIGGVGVFHDAGDGTDTYSSRALAQGFGMFGIGLMVDAAGYETYRVGIYGQGSARKDGVGHLVDRRGNDTYHAGGLQVNAPMFTDITYSFSQGYGAGYREDAGGHGGGIGLLTDHRGHDTYLSDTYGQAASYWYAVGSLFDAEGNDRYTAHHYSQSSAMHLTSAYLFDLAGDDIYTLRIGAGHAIGHDYGVAFLLDRTGDDLYASRDSRPGTGINSGLGIAIDAAGVDTYTGRPGHGASSGLGVFADLGSVDFYLAGALDGTVWHDNVNTVGFDAVTPPGQETEGQRALGQWTVEPGSKQMVSEAEMAELWRKAAQWQVGTAIAESNRALDDLVSIGMPAFEWVLANRLSTIDRISARTLGYLVDGIGPDAVAALGVKAIQANDRELEGIIRAAVFANIRDVGALLGHAIQNKPSIRRLAVSAAGSLKAMGAVDALMPLVIGEDKALARSAMASLAQIGDRSSVGTALSMLNSPDPSIRESAIQLVSLFPDDSYTVGKRLVADMDATQARIGLRLLAASNKHDVLKEVATALVDPRPGVRITALQLLAGRCPPESVDRFMILRDDPVALVRQTARMLQP